MPLLLPDDPTPEGRLCVTLQVPDDLEHYGQFWGHLRQLEKYYTWEEDDTNTRDSIANMWHEIIEQSHTDFLAGICGMGVQDMRVEGCVLQKYVDGAWVDVATLLIAENLTAEGLPAGEEPTVSQDECAVNFGIPAGEQGIQGIAGQDGQDGASGNIASLVATTDFNLEMLLNESRCTIASQLGQWLIDKFNDVLNIAEAAIDAVSAVDGFMILFPPAYIIVDQILDAINEIEEAGINIIRAGMDTEWEEDLMGRLFCAQDEIEFDPEDFENFKDAIIADEWGGIAGLAFYAYLVTLEPDAISKRAALYSTVPTENALCAGWLANCIGYDWEHVFDFEIDDGGWELATGSVNTGGVWSSGTGWVTTDTTDTGKYLRSCVIKREFAPATDIVYIAGLYTMTKGGWSLSTSGAAVTIFYDPQFETITRAEVPDGENLLIEQAGLAADCALLVAAIYTDWMDTDDRFGVGILQQVTVRGKGTDPFI